MTHIWGLFSFPPMKNVSNLCVKLGKFSSKLPAFVPVSSCSCFQSYRYYFGALVLDLKSYWLSLERLCTESNAVHTCSSARFCLQHAFYEQISAPTCFIHQTRHFAFWNQDYRKKNMTSLLTEVKKKYGILKVHFILFQCFKVVLSYNFMGWLLENWLG